MLNSLKLVSVLKFCYLQVKEHLEIFAVLKGVEADGIDTAVTDMIEEV